MATQDHKITYNEKSSLEVSGSSEKSHEHELNTTQRKGSVNLTTLDDAEIPEYDENNDGVAHISGPLEGNKNILLNVLHVEDDPTLNPWTFRTFFLGIGLSIFGAVLQEIFFFKPQTIFVSLVFLTVIAYVLGEFMALVIPSRGIFRYLNPHSFNSKELAAITIMASAATQAALSTQAIAAQAMYYNGFPSQGFAILVTISSQLVGFGFAGLLRDVLVFPSNMLWPIALPVSTLIENLTRDKKETAKKMKWFYIGFGVMFFYEILPEYIMPTLVGVSVFCLANQHSLVFTNIFGGADGNEGLGVLSLCFDWNYIIAVFSPLWFPWQSTVNQFIGIMICYALFAGVYYGNIWGSLDYPFLAEALFSRTSTPDAFVIYNQTAVLDDNFKIDLTKTTPEEFGLPALTGTYIVYIITSNMAFTAAFTHMLLWNWKDLKAGFTWAKPSVIGAFFTTGKWKFWQNAETPAERLARKQDDALLDPHYKLMLVNGYKESPNWAWAIVAIVCWCLGVGALKGMDSTLPVWGYIVATLFTFVCLLFFGAMMGITGFQFNMQPVVQLIAGYMFPRAPLANLYFTCYSFNTLQQGQLLAKDMKIAQYAHLPPQCTFVVQVLGCIIGSLFNYLMMHTIVTNNLEILQGIEGSTIWSGQNIQIFNTQAFSFSLGPELYSFGKQYQWATIAFLVGFLVPIPFYLAHRLTGWWVWSYFNATIILWYCGNLFTGVNSSFTTVWICAFISQFYLRRYKSELFAKYNYLMSAALDGGTQVVVFILTFAVAGGSGTAHPFPNWAMNPNLANHNTDYCMVNPANGG